VTEPYQSSVYQPGISDNVAGGIAYLTIIPAVVFLIIEPYRKSSFVRFHAWQSIFFFVGMSVVYIVLGALLGIVPFTGAVVVTLWRLLDLAFFVVWIIVMINAFNGKLTKLPLIGNFAEQQANR
jgi:uncharacterized membrane protein